MAFTVGFPSGPSVAPVSADTPRLQTPDVSGLERLGVGVMNLGRAMDSADTERAKRDGTAGGNQLLSEDADDLLNAKALEKRNADGITPVFIESRKVRREAIAKTLSPLAKQYFDQVADHTFTQFKSSIAEHEAKQFRATQVENISNRADALIKVGKAGLGNIDVQQTMIDGLVAAADEASQITGSDGAVTRQEFISSGVSALVTDLVNRGQAGDIDNAKALFYGNRKSLTIKADDHISSELQKGGAIKLAVDKVTALEASGLTFPEQEAKLANDPDLQANPTAFHLAESRLKGHYEMNIKLKRDASVAAVHDARATVIGLMGPLANNYWAALSSKPLADMIADPKTRDEGMAFRVWLTGQAEAAKNRDKKLSSDELWDAQSKFASILYTPDMMNWSEGRLKSESLGLPEPLRTHLHNTWVEMRETGGGQRLNANKLFIEKALFDNGTIKSILPKANSPDAQAVATLTAVIEAQAPGERRILKWDDPAQQKFIARWAQQYKIDNGFKFLGMTFGAKTVPLYQVIKMIPADYRAKAGPGIPDEVLAKAYAEDVTSGKLKHIGPVPTAQDGNEVPAAGTVAATPYVAPKPTLAEQRELHDRRVALDKRAAALKASQGSK